MKNEIKIAMHPATSFLLREIGYEQRMYSPSTIFGAMSLFGFKTILDPDLEKYSVSCGDWIFPKEPFVTYEPADVSWCKYFGIGYRDKPIIETGRIAIYRSLPVQEFQHIRVKFPGYKDQEEYGVFEDDEYVKACECVRMADKILMQHMHKIADRLTRNSY